MIEHFDEPFYVKYEKRYIELRTEFDEWCKNNDAKESDELKAEYYRLRYEVLWISNRMRMSKLYEEIRDLRAQVKEATDVEV